MNVKKKRRGDRETVTRITALVPQKTSAAINTHAKKRTTIESINRGRGRGKPEYRITETEAQTRTTPKLEKRKEQGREVQEKKKRVQKAYLNEKFRY